MSNEELFLLLRKYKENNLSEDESFRLQTWMNESPENKLLVTNFVKMYKLEAQYKAARLIDVPKAWTTFCRRRRNRRWRIVGYRVMAAACISGLVWMAAYFSYSAMHQEPQSSENSTVLLKHGSRKAVLTLVSGEKIEVNIGEDDKDPVFVITDLLPHLAQEQMKRSLAEGVKGEELNLLIGSIPYNDSDVSEKVKLNILNMLNQKYGITEVDFLSAELEIVPAFKARSLGLDSSMVAAYGQDDKICVYTSLTALMNIQDPKTTAVCLISDKEEIGSMGNTGMESHVFDTFISEILNKLGVNRPNLLDKVFCNSKMLSADVDAGLDPTFVSVAEKNNASYLGRGIGLNKYTGGRGKSGSSDANAEFVAYIRNILESNNIAYQIAELGKVDLGGGGTIAYILANKGMDVIDCGVPVLSMHAPYEVTSKFDVYSAFTAYKAFFRA